MRIISPSHKIETPRAVLETALTVIEAAARTCYKSEDKVCEGSAAPFIQKLMAQKPPHRSVIEHVSFSVRFVCDRGVTHEIVRHRLASFSQESTRYCNYSKGKFGSEITVIKPCFWEEGSAAWQVWESGCLAAEAAYNQLMKMGCKPQEARSVLPNSLKTEIVMTANLREWHTVFEQRTAPMAHPQMREIMVPLLNEVKQIVPVIFDDIIP